jgi:hypothetical protein
MMGGQEGYNNNYYPQSRGYPEQGARYPPQVSQ